MLYYVRFEQRGQLETGEKLKRDQDAQKWPEEEPQIA
jgi:hypothetical protein